MPVTMKQARNRWRQARKHGEARSLKTWARAVYRDEFEVTGKLARILGRVS